jgi:hypothetical protein
MFERKTYLGYYQIDGGDKIYFTEGKKSTLTIKLFCKGKDNISFDFTDGDKKFTLGVDAVKEEDLYKYSDVRTAEMVGT